MSDLCKTKTFINYKNHNKSDKKILNRLHCITQLLYFQPLFNKKLKNLTKKIFTTDVKFVLFLFLNIVDYIGTVRKLITRIK